MLKPIRRRPHLSRTAKMLAAVLLSLVSSPARGAWGEPIDRILAVVNDQPITLSDVRLARDLGLVNAGTGGDPIRATLDRLIDRALMLGEVRRYSTSDPDEAAVTRRLQGVRDRLSSGAALDAALAAGGLTEEQLRELLRDDERIDAYLDQRFPSAAQPTDEEVAVYGRSHPASGGNAASGVEPPQDTRASIVARMAADRRQTLIGEWLNSLRARIGVTDLYVVSP